MRRGRSAPRLAALLLAVIGLVALPAPAQAQPEMELDPASGTPGSTVTVRVSGFEGCVGIDFERLAVDLLWDGDRPIGSVTPGDDGSAETEIEVPGDVGTGSHVVLARCSFEALGLEVRGVFEIVSDQVTVPDLTDRTLDEARTILSDLDLELGAVTGEGDTIQNQDPPPFEPVDPGTAVDVELGGNPPPPPEIPPSGAIVPDVTGLDLAQVRAVLDATSLRLNVVGDPDGRATSQDPSAGLEVPGGTVVTVSFESGTPWWPIAVGGLFVLGAAVASTVAVRRDARRRWVRAHVSVRPGAAPHGEVDVETHIDEETGR